MDIIFIRELRIETIIGVFDWERSVRQSLSIDLDLGVDIRTAAASDDIADTPSYSEISARLLDFVGASRCELIETLAEQIAALLRDEFGVRWLRLSVHKPGAVREARDVGVTIERGERF